MEGGKGAGGPPPPPAVSPRPFWPLAGGFSLWGSAKSMASCADRGAAEACDRVRFLPETASKPPEADRDALHDRAAVGADVRELAGGPILQEHGHLVLGQVLSELRGALAG